MVGIAGLCLVAVVGVVMLVSYLGTPRPGEDGWIYFSDNELAERAELRTQFDPEIANLDTLAAVPGETFVGGEDALVVGVDIPSGVYVAPDALLGDDVCRWSVDKSDDPGTGGLHAGTAVREGVAMLLAPEGYFVEATPECGTWVAIDPATAHEGGTRTEIAESFEDGKYRTHLVGGDLVPGLYASTGDIPMWTDCMVFRPSDFGFSSKEYPSETWRVQRRGTVLVPLKQGDAVWMSECPGFQLIDFDELQQSRDGGQEILEGRSVVGIDIVPGTYTSPDIASGYTCEMTLSTYSVASGDLTEVAYVHYTSRDRSKKVTVEAGQEVLIPSYSCGVWALDTSE